MDQYCECDGKPDWEGTMYGESIAYGEECRVPGYELTDQLTVFAMIEGTYLKLVGLHHEGKYVGRGWDGCNTLEAVEQAWDNPSGTAGKNYQVKAMRSMSCCSAGKVKLYLRLKAIQ